MTREVRFQINSRKMHRPMWLAASLLAIVSVCWSQGSTSTVRGTVHDQGQAVIPNATVTLTNTATGTSRTTVTNEAGLYVFPATTPGPYRITGDSPGLQRFEGTLTVQVQQDAVIDLTLQIAQAAISVDVQDVTPMVRMDSPTLGHALERKRIEQLPINGRGYSALLQTVPGVSATGRIQAYGLRPGSHTLQFDGASMNEVWEGWDVGRTPGLDAIEEFQVEVNNSSAKFTRPTTVVLSSRSGSNQVHGALFYTNRNSGYGVARQRQDTFTKPPYLNRNEYGVSLGGPVTIPKLYNGHNRTFFFFAWEGLRNISNTTQRWSVPTEAMRNGDFRGLVDSQGRQFNLYDPLTTDASGKRQPLTYNGVANMIDPARLSPVAKSLFAITPLPTHPQINPLTDNNWIGPVPRLRDDETWSVRIDHRFGDKDLFYSRLSRGYVNEAYQYPNQPMLNNISSVTNRWWPNTALAATWVHTFAPSLTNELILSGTRDFQRRGTGDYETKYTNGFNLPNPFQSPNWPTFSSTGLSAGGNGEYLFGGDGLFWLITNVASVQDNVTKTHGKHEFQFGFHYRYEQINKSVTPLAGPFTFDTLATAQIDPASAAVNPLPLQFTGHNLANMYLGEANYTTQFRRPWYYMRRDEYAPYFQDNWKITKRLTLNLGLRYEYRSPITDRQNTQISFSPEKRAYVLGTDLDRFTQLGGTLPSIVRTLRDYGGNIITYQEAGLPQALVKNNWNNWGPRIGFAYRAFDGGKALVIRGGFRTSYYPNPMSLWFNSTQTTPTIVSTNFQRSVTNTSTSPDGLPNYGLRTVPQLVAGVNTTDSIIDLNDTRALPRGFTASYMDPNQPDAKVYDWNFTIEKEVMPNTVLRLAYVGNNSVNQQMIVRENESTPDYIWYMTRREPTPTGPFSSVARRPYDQQVYGTVNRSANIGFSRNNSFQVEIERRYAKGIAGQFFWVTGNTLATSGDVYSSNFYMPGAAPADPLAQNRFLNYARDINTPKHQMRWNWIADIPVGRGKKFASSSRGFMEALVGGWQIAGTGNWRSNYFSLPTNIYPNGNPVEIYGEKYRVEDCRSGACFPGYLWFNGYIPANQINSVDSKGKPNGIMGVPDNYKASGAPLIPWGATSAPNMPAGTNLSGFWDTNNVWIPLNNGTVQRVTFNDNLHPWRNQFFKAPNQWGLDASLFKFVKLTEKVTMRFNVDMFNVLNHPNDPIIVDPTGVLTTRNSGVSARVMQLTARLTW
jgi:hypothetical protein